jgi:allantoin racemase
MTLTTPATEPLQERTGTYRDPVRVHVVVPIVTQGFRSADEFQTRAGAGVEVTMSQVKTGPASIESEYEDALSVPGILAAGLEAQRAGAQAIVIDCMADPGIMAARELLDIPVFGPCQTSMSVAGILGHKFGFLTIMDELLTVVESRAAVYGQKDKLAGIRSVNVPVLELEADRDRTVELLLSASLDLIRSGAGSLVFGCTGLMWAAEALEERLSTEGFPGVPVINPIPTTINVAAGILASGLRASKASYPKPPVKELVGYPDLDGATGPA